MDRVRPVLLICCLLSLMACSSLPINFERSASFALTNTQQTSLARRATQVQLGKPEETVSFLINEGTEAFLARILLLKEAEKSIDVQYYIWHADLIGKTLFFGLLKAAERGVRVRLLLDDINIDDEVESILYALNQHDNIQVHLFNPFASRDFRGIDYITDASRINRRMHNKSFTVDNQFTVVGGRNIGNEYFAADKVSNFRDIDVMATGPVVQKVSNQFDLYWNSKAVYPLSSFRNNKVTKTDLEHLKSRLADFVKKQDGSKYHLDLKDTNLFKLIDGISGSTEPLKPFRGDIKVVYDEPEKGLGKTEKEIVYLKTLVQPHLEAIKESFELVSPYFVPGSDGVDFLINMVNRGIKVSVVTNSLSSTDGLMAQSGYSRHRSELLKGGVELYELKAHSKTKASRSLRRGAKAKSGLHAKTYILDRKEVFIGSFNFDQRSANINSEVGVIYLIPEMASHIAKNIFDLGIREHTYKVEILTEDKILGDNHFSKGQVIWIEFEKDKILFHQVDPGTSWWRRANETLLELLPIESQL